MTLFGKGPHFQPMNPRALPPPFPSNAKMWRLHKDLDILVEMVSQELRLYFLAICCAILLIR
jgi:hypothetical protein